MISGKKIVQRIFNIFLDTYGKQGWWPINGKYFPEKIDKFEICIGTILTQNTAWKNVETSLASMRKNNLISPQKILKCPQERLAGIIRSSGYFNQKAKKLKNMAEFFVSQKAITRENLLGINGVGPETADSILLYAYNIPSFVVDAYTKRIFNRIGLISAAEKYDRIKELFEVSLSEDVYKYNEYHALIVKHGKDVCKKKPLCSVCVLREIKICSYVM